MSDKIRAGIGLFIVCSLFVSIFYFRHQKTPKPGFLLIESPSNPTSRLSGEVAEIVRQLNDRNSKASTFYCDRIKIVMNNNVCIRASAEVYYAKDKQLRMLIRSMLGQEMDIGSNVDYFWFWSKRMEPPALYYSEYKNIHRSGLKTPFNPMWLKGIFGLDEVNIVNAIACKRGKHYEIRRPENNIQCQPVIRSTIIDPQSLSIVGHYIYQNGRLICSAEAYETTSVGVFVIPSKILVKWYEENVTMVFELQNCYINEKIDNSIWKMPEMHQKIDLSFTKLVSYDISP